MTNTERKALCKRIQSLYYKAHNHLGIPHDLDRAKDIAAKQEREHRRFGRRLVGNIGSRASVETCAMMFALRGFVTPKDKRHYSDRSDFIAAYCAADRAEHWNKTAEAYRAFCEEYGAEIDSWDYVQLIGGT